MDVESWQSSNMLRVGTPRRRQPSNRTPAWTDRLSGWFSEICLNIVILDPVTHMGHASRKKDSPSVYLCALERINSVVLEVRTPSFPISSMDI